MTSSHSRIFLDVGGYRGTSALAALDPIFAFDRVYCFEPVPRLADFIRKRIASPKLVVVDAALADKDGTATLYHSGSLAGSLFQDAPAYGVSDGSIDIRMIDVASFIQAHISAKDFVRIKFNCEGAETLIIRRMIEAGLTAHLNGALVDFDADKIHSLEGAADMIRKELADAGVKFFQPPEVQYGWVTNYGGVRNWLLRADAAGASAGAKLGSLVYNLHLLLTNNEVNGYHKIRILRALGLRKR